MAFLSLILGFILGAGAFIFAIQNNEIVSLTFLGWQFQSSLAVVIILATITGLLLGILLSVPSILRRAFTIMTLQKEKRALHNEMDTMREDRERELVQHASTVDTAPPDVIDLRS